MNQSSNNSDTWFPVLTPLLTVILTITITRLHSFIANVAISRALCESTYRNFRCRASINSPQLDGPIYPQFYQLIKHLKQFFHNYYIPWRDFGLGYFVGTNFNIGNKFYICCDRPTILQSLFRIRDVFPPEVYLPHLVPSVYCVVNLMKLSLQNDNISILQFLLKILVGNFINILRVGPKWPRGHRR